jgi:Pyruvate/2-oxoacid:ferredoxin oxidoreductase gamma subunit
MSTTKVIVEDRFGSYLFKGCGLVLLGHFTITLNQDGRPIFAEAEFHGNPITKRMIIDDPDILRIFEKSQSKYVINMNHLDNPVRRFSFEATGPLDKDDDGDDPMHESWESVRMVYWRDVSAEREEAKKEKMKRAEEEAHRRRRG